MGKCSAGARSRRRCLGRCLAVLAATAIACLLAMPTAFASAAARWDAAVFWGPTALQPGERGGFRLEVGNVGDERAEGWPTVEVALPEGVFFDESDEESAHPWDCAAAGAPQTVTCDKPTAELSPSLWPKPNTYVGSERPIFIQFTVDIAADAPVGIQPLTVTLSGGGAAGPTSVVEEVRVGGPPASFGVREGSFEAGPLDESLTPYARAGGHPYEAVVGFAPRLGFRDPAGLGNRGGFAEMLEPIDSPRDLVVDLPPGFAGVPAGTPTCPKSHIPADAPERCPPSTQVGLVEVNNLVMPQLQMFALYNVTPSRGAPAQFMFGPPEGFVALTPVLRSDSDWGLSIQIRGLPTAVPIFGVEVRLWGVPADPGHDRQRCLLPSHVGQICSGYSASGEPADPPSLHDPDPSTAPRRALLTMPTHCDGEPHTSTAHLDSLHDPAPFTADGDPDLTSESWLSYSYSTPPVEGCELLEFDPSLKASPTTNAADSPTGLDVDLGIPQNLDPDGLATAHLEKAVVTLPRGLVVNPSGASGLEVCSEAQARLGDRLPAECPEASKVGTVSVKTPVLDDPLSGAVYVATPHRNPFGSLLALYVTIDDPKTGIAGKIPGQVTPDPRTGRLIATFDKSPQLAFEDFELDFFGGAEATLSTPPECGAYSTTSRLTPYSAPHTGPPATAKHTWAIERGANGGPCALPHAPSFRAGSTAPIAGAHSPFVVDLRRQDGSQRFSAAKVTPPPGLIAKLAGVPYCSELALTLAGAKGGRDEQASPSCPAASEIGSVTVGAGSGRTPYQASGKAYLAGPYKGAPLSLAIVTPAVAGPFDLGTIVVRAALRVNPVTARITAVSDRIPAILQGIPLNVRSVQIKLDRPGFTRNPTNCDAAAVGGSLISAVGQTAPLRNYFQARKCRRLGFKPRMRLSLLGPAHRGAHPKLRAVVATRSGDANIEALAIKLPETEHFESAQVRGVCTADRYEAGDCPPSSAYGYARVWSPLLDEPLAGPVYLRSSRRDLPDLVASLRGQVQLDLAARVDSPGGRVRIAFRNLPDVPLRKVVLSMRGGRAGLLVNNTGLCRARPRVRVTLEGQNRKIRRGHPVVRTNCRQR